MQLGAEAVFVGSGIFKSQRSRSARQGHCEGQYPLRGSQGHPRSVRRTRRSYARFRRSSNGRKRHVVHTRLVSGGINFMKIGILAVQGDFEAHAAMLHGLGVETVEVRTVADLQGCDGTSFPAERAPPNYSFCRKRDCSTLSRNFLPTVGRSLAPVLAPYCWPLRSRIPLRILLHSST